MLDFVDLSDKLYEATYNKVYTNYNHGPNPRRYPYPNYSKYQNCETRTWLDLYIDLYDKDANNGVFLPPFAEALHPPCERPWSSGSDLYYSCSRLPTQYPGHPKFPEYPNFPEYGNGGHPASPYEGHTYPAGAEMKSECALNVHDPCNLKEHKNYIWDENVPTDKRHEPIQDNRGTHESCAEVEKYQCGCEVWPEPGTNQTYNCGQSYVTPNNCPIQTPCYTPKDPIHVPYLDSPAKELIGSPCGEALRYFCEPIEHPQYIQLKSMPELLRFDCTCCDRMARALADYWKAQVTPALFPYKNTELPMSVAITNDAEKIYRPIANYMCCYGDKIRHADRNFYEHLFHFIEHQVKKIVWTVYLCKGYAVKVRLY